MLVALVVGVVPKALVWDKADVKVLFEALTIAAFTGVVSAFDVDVLADLNIFAAVMAASDFVMPAPLEDFSC